MVVATQKKWSRLAASGLVWVCLALAFDSLRTASAVTQIVDDSGCSSCVASGNIVCRPDFYDRYSFCCAEAEVGSRSCGGSNVFCTTESLNPVMNAFACPYSYGYCGASSSELVMHPQNRNNLKIEISNRLFVDDQTCYYVFSVPEGDLDQVNFRYFWDVEIYEMTNVVIQMNNGTSLETANDPITVSFTTGYRFQYTAETNNVYMTFTGNVPASSSKSAAFGFTIKLRSFDIRTPEPEVDEVVIDVPKPDDPVDDPEETGPDLIPDDVEQANDTDSEPIIVTETEYITVRKPATVTEASKLKKRKSQEGLTALTGAIFLGTLIYILIGCCGQCKKKSQERKQIKSMTSMNTIVVGNNPDGSRAGLVGGSPSKVDDDDFFDNTEKRQARLASVSGEIEENDAGKKGKRKQRRAGKGKDGDALEHDEMNNSWDSSRMGAKVIDLSNQMTPAASGMNSRKKHSNHLEINHPYTATGKSNRNISGMNSGSYQGSDGNLSVRDRLDQIENIGGDGFNQAAHMTMQNQGSQLRNSYNNSAAYAGTDGNNNGRQSMGVLSRHSNNDFHDKNLLGP